MEVRFIKAEDIDRAKWNSCVHYANLGNIFGYHWYLNNVIKEWDGLVEGDYESVMPLIKRKGNFFSKPSLYTHELLANTGIYSVHVLSEKRIRTFLEAIPVDYKKWQFRLNEGMKVPSNFDLKIKDQKTNGLLLLKEPYDAITKNYQPALLQKLERAKLAELFSVNNLKPEVLVDLYKAHDRQWKEKNYHTYLRIMYNALHRGWGLLTGVKNKKDELLAANFFIFSHGRLMSLLPVVTSSGLQNGALEFLFDWTIRIQADKPLILDFNVEKIGSFERQFGITESPYWLIGR